MPETDQRQTIGSCSGMNGSAVVVVAVVVVAVVVVKEGSEKGVIQLKQKLKRMLIARR